MERASFHFVTTRNCNVTCKHCYLTAGPGKKGTSINEEDFERVVGHFPKIPRSYIDWRGDLYIRGKIV